MSLYIICGQQYFRMSNKRCVYTRATSLLLIGWLTGRSVGWHLASEFVLQPTCSTSKKESNTRVPVTPSLVQRMLSDLPTRNSGLSNHFVSYNIILWQYRLNQFGHQWCSLVPSKSMLQSVNRSTRKFIWRWIGPVFPSLSQNVFFLFLFFFFKPNSKTSANLNGLKTNDWEQYECYEWTVFPWTRTRAPSKQL